MRHWKHYLQRRYNITSQQWRVVAWCLGGLLVSWVAFVCWQLSQFDLVGPGVAHDTILLSPDRTYTATLHDVDTGAAGSYCQALLRRTSDKSNETVIVDGGYKFVDEMEWGDGDILTITTNLEGKPDPSWPKSWQGVKIKYKW